MRVLAFKIAVLAMALLFAGPKPVAAGDWSTAVAPENPVLRYEAWIGGDATGFSQSLYGGMTTALTGDIREDGFRLRSAAGYGTYSYTSLRWNGTARVPVHYSGVQSFTDLLLGYQQTFGAWTVKIYAGGAQDRHLLLPFDTENSVQGAQIGAKAAIETWWNIADIAFLQTDASWSQVFDTYGGRVRAGYRVNPAVSVGVEGALNGNAVYESARAGAFARLEWTRGELSASGGLAGDHAGVTGAYGSLGLLMRF